MTAAPEAPFAAPAPPPQDLPGGLPPLQDIPQATGTSELAVDEPAGDWKQDFHGLLHIGALSASFEYLGHKIAIRTLTTDEELIVGQLTAEYSGTIAEPKAYQLALICMAVQSIDGQALPLPLGEGTDQIAWARERFAYARRWYPFTLDIIHTRYLELEGRVRVVLDEMGKASPGTGPGSNGNAGSPSERESSAGTASP